MYSLYMKMFYSIFNESKFPLDKFKGGTPNLVTGTYPPPSILPPPPKPPSYNQGKISSSHFLQVSNGRTTKDQELYLTEFPTKFSQQLQHNVILLIDSQNRLPKTYVEILYTFCLENGLQMNLSVRSKYLIILDLC